MPFCPFKGWFFAWNLPPNRSKPHFMIWYFGVVMNQEGSDSLCLTTKGRDEALLSTLRPGFLKIYCPLATQNCPRSRKFVAHLKIVPNLKICCPLASQNCPQSRKLVAHLKRNSQSGKRSLGHACVPTILYSQPPSP